MKKLNNCVVDNCIPSPTSCNEWNGGDIQYLGICNGDSLNNLLWEIINKLEDITGEDLSLFDIDSLIDICNKKAPVELTILSILNVLKENQICLKEFIDAINLRLNELLSESGVEVNLKCYQQFDNLGNSLSITRSQLDQLVIDNLCSQKGRIDSLEGTVINLQSQIDNLNLSPLIDEKLFSTCVDVNIKPTSSQVISIANSLCQLKVATGEPSEIISALAQTPSTDTIRYGTLTGWITVPSNWADNYNNLLLKVAKLETDIRFMQENCCALTCEDIKLGFTAVLSEDRNDMIISFTFGAGTVIPSGFTDGGSTGTVTDEDGNMVTFNLTISNNSQTTIPLTGLNANSELTVTITSILTNGSLTCQKCLTRKVKLSGCCFCTITATGTGTGILVYDDTVVVPTTGSVLAVTV